MLLSIHVKNIALIQEIEIELGTGMNILTGETGAGKSLLLGAVNVALGTEGFRGFARENAEYALVELVFSVENEKIIHKLKQLEVETEEHQVIISRKLVNGRSISKINGETVPVSKIREIAQVLIDIHGQHEHQSLLYPKNHLVILDEYAKEEIDCYLVRNGEIYLEYQKKKKKLQEMQMDDADRAKEEDFLRFEIEEIQSADLKSGEDEELENVYRKMANARKITELVSETEGYTNSERGGAGEMLERAIRTLAEAAELDDDLQSLSSQLYDTESMLHDFNRELSYYAENLSSNDASFSQVEDRLNLINHLKKKYGKNISEILLYQKEKQDRLSVLEDYEEHCRKISQECEKCKEELYKTSKKISEIRHHYAAELEVKIKTALEDLNFLGVNFVIHFEELEEAGKTGLDHICFQISTNPGESVKPLQEVASGGELSRIMLAVKAVLADKDDKETLIFDEIDTGISGRTAQKVSEKMVLIAKNHQVICITHLAQIASMADHHFIIEKQSEHDITSTSIRTLTQEESVRELARILGGVEITETVLQNAKEMKELASSTKKY